MKMRFTIIPFLGLGLSILGFYILYLSVLNLLNFDLLSYRFDFMIFSDFVCFLILIFDPGTLNSFGNPLGIFSALIVSSESDRGQTNEYCLGFSIIF